MTGNGLSKLLIQLMLLVMAALSAGPLHAQGAPSDAMKAKIEAAWNAASRTAIRGPADVKLVDQATIKIEADQVFIPAAEANQIMEALGNPALPIRQGLVVSADDRSPWMVDIAWIKEGYVRDGDAKEWKADALLESLREGTERDNEDRVKQGYAALDVVGWVEQPRYDSATNRLVWSLSLKERGTSASTPQTINYNTYALGREGYFSLDLITGSNSIATDKLVAEKLLASLSYASGHTYADFDESTDKVAAYGIGALVGIAAAKKLGLLAVIGLFLAKTWKLALLAIFGVGAFVRRMLGRQNTEEEAGKVVSDDEVSSHGSSENSEAVPIGKPDEGDRPSG